MPDDLTLLKSVPMFQSLSDRDVQALYGILKRVHFEPGRTIFKYGDPGDTMYIVCSGSVKFFHRTNIGEELLLEEAGEGSIFGEVAVLTGGSRTATAQVTHEMVALELRRSDLEGFLAAHPGVMMTMLGQMAWRMRRSGDQLRYSSTRNANEVEAAESTPTDNFIHNIARMIGSLPFLALHALIYGTWIGANLLLGKRAFDPFPFSLLSLVIAIEAVYISGVVLISQNQQTARDFVRNEIEFQANVGAEKEIAHLHEKLDDLRADLLRHHHVQRETNRRHRS